MIVIKEENRTIKTMDNVKVGQLIYKLRKEKNLTQLDIATSLGISDKAISKWERGLGAPDISLLPELSKILNVDLEKLLSGEITENKVLSGNMKRNCFYYCPNCGNIVVSTTETPVSCCGKRLSSLKAKKANEEEKLTIEKIDNEYYISSNHSMTKDHYISFVTLLTGDSLLMRKLYPEWDLSLRLPFFPHCLILWYCTKDGLYYQSI